MTRERINFENINMDTPHVTATPFLGVGTIIFLVIGGMASVLAIFALTYKYYPRKRNMSNSMRLSEALRKRFSEEENISGTNIIRKSWSVHSKSSSTSSHSGKAATSSENITSTSSHQLIASEKEQSMNSTDNLGELTFSVTYDKQKQILLVTVVKCSDLIVRDPQLGTSDPYVKLQLLPEKRHRVKTRVLRKTCNPVYEETFTFFGITVNQIKCISMHFVVLSFDRFSRDEIIGEVLYPLTDFDVNNTQATTLTMRINPRQFKLDQTNRGELLVSLCHQPAASRLTVVVLKARNLPKMDVTGLAGDPYVKVYLLFNGQRIAKKKTHVKKRTINPVYNESFAFEIPGNEDLTNVSVEFQILDWDRVTKNEVIGRVEIGSNVSNELACKHWQEVMNNARKQIAEWHKFTE